MNGGGRDDGEETEKGRGGKAEKLGGPVRRKGAEKDITAAQEIAHEGHVV